MARQHHPLSGRECAAARGLLSLLVAVGFVAGPACSPGGEETAFRPSDPGAGPGQLVGNGGPITDGNFEGGADSIPSTRAVDEPQGTRLPDCKEACRQYCDDQNLENPVNRGICPSLWGVGVDNNYMQKGEACRRVYADMVGRFPTFTEVQACKERPWKKTVRKLIDSDRFVLVNRRRWADELLYNNEAVSVVRIFDADDLARKLYRGLVPYDQFAAVISAHPVLTRRYTTAGDRAEALFELFMGRPPLGNERSDMARLYNLWDGGYYDHPELGLRLPDAYIDFECVTEEGRVDEDSKGECTSILWGYNELILKPDLRAKGEPGDERMWAGQLRADEWSRLQMPGRILSEQRTFWEHAVEDALEQYFDYDLGSQVPRVRDELVEYFLQNNADIRSIHYAIATSIPYRQSAFGKEPSPYRWSWGPLKQVHAEVWIDSIKRTTGYDLSRCDHRLPETGDLEGSDDLDVLAMLENSRWELTDDTELREGYRNLARGLGGCPRNDVGGRFRAISVLTTAKQLNFVNEVCAPKRESTGGVPAGRLLPNGVPTDRAVSPDLAPKIVRFQTQKFFGRNPSERELEKARSYGEECSRSVCTAEEFARPACFALLSSSEMLFY